jgi:Ribosomal protein L16p/L10e
MGKGKGGFDHWGVLYPAGRMLFEISAPGIRREIVKQALVKAGRALPGTVGFVDKMSGLAPATIGLSRSEVYHAGFKVEGSIDTKIRAKENPPVVVSKQIGYEKLAKTPKGLIRRA